MNDRFSVLNRLYFILLSLFLPCLGSAQTTIDTLPPIDSLSDWQVNALIQQYTAQARDMETLLSEKSQRASSRKAAMAETLNLAKADSTISKPAIDSIAGLLKLAKKEAATAQKNLRQAQKTLAALEKASDIDNDKKRKQLASLRKQLVKTTSLVYPPESPSAAETPPKPAKATKAKKAKKEQPPQEETTEAPFEESTVPAVASGQAATTAPKPQPNAPVRTKKYDPALDVMLHPPGLQCRLAVDTRDEFSGERYRRTVPVELFRHSPAALKNYLQGKPNVQCTAALASSGSNFYLHLIFTINDPNPRKAFGRIDKESLATLKFIDGSSYNIYNQLPNEGIQNLETQAFTYQAQYLLPADVLKKIRRSELDKLRIAWSSGYEDYDVQHVVLLMQQEQCLSNN